MANVNSTLDTTLQDVVLESFSIVPNRAVLSKSLSPIGVEAIGRQAQIVVVREVATLIELEPRSTSAFYLKDSSGKLSGAFKVYPVSQITESAQLNDTVSYDQYVAVRDAAVLRSTFYPLDRYISTFIDAAQLSSTAYGSRRISESVTESAPIYSRYEFEHAILLTDVAVVIGTARPSNKATATERESALVQGSARVVPGLNLRETAVTSSTGSVAVIYRSLVRDVTYINENYLDVLRQANLLRDSAQVTGLPSYRLTARPVLREYAYLNDIASPPAYGRAYTCSISSWGMSVFSNFAFTSMAGKYASGNNLWRLDSDDDNGTPITSFITTGKLDVGGAQFKRPSAVYVDGSAQSPLTVTISGDVDGVFTSADYSIEARNQEDYRNNRAIIGKGFRSRYLQVKIGGTGFKYSLLSAAMDVAASSRRV